MVDTSTFTPAGLLVAGAIAAAPTGSLTHPGGPRPTVLPGRISNPGRAVDVIIEAGHLEPRNRDNPGRHHQSRPTHPRHPAARQEPRHRPR